MKTQENKLLGRKSFARTVISQTALVYPTKETEKRIRSFLTPSGPKAHDLKTGILRILLSCTEKEKQLANNKKKISSSGV